MSFEYINKNKLNLGNSVKGGQKFKELMKDPEWKAEWLKKTYDASHKPEQEAKRSAKMKANLKEYNWWNGRTHSDETKAKMSESAKERMQRCGNPAQGQVWVCNEKLKENKRIPGTDLQQYLDAGWIKGRKMTFK